MKTALGLASLLLACAACVPTAPVPAALAPHDGSQLAMVARASGAQVYECRVRKDDSDRYEWALVAPDAELVDVNGQIIGHHGAGPAWDAVDGSRVVGTLVARADAPSAGAIPWLLLSGSSDGPHGMFSDVTSIQRVNTAGGITPAIPCNRAGLNRQLRVSYSADYRFFVKPRIA